jgi:hypothetical protein
MRLGARRKGQPERLQSVEKPQMNREHGRTRARSRLSHQFGAGCSMKVAENAHDRRARTCAGGSELFSIPVAGRPLRLSTEPTAACVRSVVHDAAALYWLTDKASRHAAK